METKSEDTIHKLRLRLNERAYDQFNNNNNNNTHNNNTQYNYNHIPSQTKKFLNNDTNSIGSFNETPSRSNLSFFQSKTAAEIQSQLRHQQFQAQPAPVPPPQPLPPLQNDINHNLNSRLYSLNNHQRMNSNLYIDFNATNNLFSNQIPITNSVDLYTNHTNLNHNEFQPYDGLQARRRIFNDLTSANVARADSLKYPPPQQHLTQYLNGTIDSRISPIISPNKNLEATAYNETIVTNDVDELIDVMAKRRLAIKHLENEMVRQHSRAATMIKSNYDNHENPARNSRLNLRPNDPYQNQNRQFDPYHNQNLNFNPNQNQNYNQVHQQNQNPHQNNYYNNYNPNNQQNFNPNFNPYERQSRNGAIQNVPYDPQVSFSSKTPIRSLVRNETFTDQRQPTNISKIEYPSETNREIFSTYLLDSLKPHYSTRRLVSGKPLNNQALQNKPIIEGTNDLESFDPILNQANNYIPSQNSRTSLYKSQPNINQLATPNRSTNSFYDQINYAPSQKESRLNQNNPTGFNQELQTQKRPELLSEPDQISSNNRNSNLKNASQILSKPNFYLNDNENAETSKKNLLDNVYINENDSIDFERKTPFEEPNYRKNSTPTPKPEEFIEKKSKKSGLIERYPKLYDRQKVFWAASTIVRFICRLRIKAKETNKKNPDRSGSASIFRIRLLEIMTAIHRVYLEPEGPIYTSLMNFIKNPNDMNALFDQDNQIHDACIKILCQDVEDIVQRITEFMPKEGIIGTTSKSALLSLISEGNKFPDNYFWDEEKERLRFDENGKIRNIKKGRAILLLMSAVISRGLITTLLIKPVKFRLLRGELPKNIKINLKILATIMCYIVRKVNNNTTEPMNFPWEWQSSLFNDTRMKPIYTNPEVIHMINKCQKLFIVWANEYVNRLDETAGKERP